MVPPASHKLTGVRGTQGPDQGRRACRYGTLTRCGVAFQRLRVGSPLLCMSGPTTPTLPKKSRFRLLPFRSPLLRESRLMSSRRATEMFQFARGPPLGLCIQPRVSRHDSGWVAPFGSSGLSARMQLPLNVSPVSASFFGLQRRGILLVLSRACSACSRTVRLAPSPPSVRCALSSWFSLTALGKIEVILCYSVFQVQCQETLTTGKWKQAQQAGQDQEHDRSFSLLCQSTMYGTR